MAKKAERPLEFKKIRLFEGDFDAMAGLFPDLGASVAIRVLVHNFVKRMRSMSTSLDIPLTESVESLLESPNDNGTDTPSAESRPVTTTL